MLRMRFFRYGDIITLRLDILSWPIRAIKNSLGKTHPNTQIVNDNLERAKAKREIYAR